MIKTNTVQLTENRTLRKVFLFAALGFLAVCGVGFLVSYIVDASGVIKQALDSSGRFNMDIYKQLNGSEEVARRLAQLSIFGIVMIFASGILNTIWAFRWTRASKAFISITWTVYVIAQGIGFGILFLTWNAKDLLAVFGIAGGMFGVMALIGYLAKDLSHWGKWLFFGSIIAFVAGMIMMIMFFAGVYSDSFTMFVYGFTGILTLGWIAFDVWWVKKQTQTNLGQNVDSDEEFRIVSFFAFRLLSDLIALIWIILRFYARYNR